jgi:thiosulfate reductase cytochrome b subunit
MKKPLQSVETEIAVIAENIRYLRDDVTDIKKKLEDDYVTVAEFDPIKKVVYGLIALLLTGVVGALLAIVINKP